LRQPIAIDNSIENRQMTERHIPGGSDSISAYQDKLHQARYRWALAQLKDIKGTIVDLACGAGYGSHMLAQNTDCEVIGIDVSERAVAHAVSTYYGPRLSYRLGDAQHLDEIPPSSVNALVSFETIEHLAQPEQFLAEAARVLVPGGLLLLSTPNRRLMSSMYPIRRRPNNPFHLFEYTRDALLLDVRKSFDVRQMAGQSFVPRWLAFWPVQILVKAVCRLSRGIGGYTLADAWYHNPNDVDVLPVASQLALEPTIFVLRCHSRAISTKG
jgi:ubiquinone/menaquinone biosynthesis C-methylase UbiE